MLSITGDFETEQLINQFEKIFAGWIMNEIEYPDIPAVELSYEPSVNHIQKNLPQTTMLIGHLGIKRTPDFPDFFALSVMNNIFGEGGFHFKIDEASARKTRPGIYGWKSHDNKSLYKSRAMVRLLQFQFQEDRSSNVTYHRHYTRNA